MLSPTCPKPHRVLCHPCQTPLEAGQDSHPPIQEEEAPTLWDLLFHCPLSLDKCLKGTPSNILQISGVPLHCLHKSTVQFPYSTPDSHFYLQFFIFWPLHPYFSMASPLASEEGFLPQAESTSLSSAHPSSSPKGQSFHS